VFARRLDTLTAGFSPDERIRVQGEYVDALVEAELADTARGFRKGVEASAKKAMACIGDEWQATIVTDRILSIVRESQRPDDGEREGR
jgi:hypothetical protein